MQPASQALPREPAVAPACVFAANGATLIPVPPELPSPALTACLCSAVSMSTVHQHRAYDGRAAVPGLAANRANPFMSCSQPARRDCCDITARSRSHTTLIVYSQTFSSMRASPHHGCAVGVPRDRDPALDASVVYGRTAPPLTKGGSVPGRRSSTSGSSVTNTSCQHPLRGQLAVLDIGAVTTGRPSDCGARRAATTATLTHSGHCAAFCALRIHRYGVVVSARHFGGAV